MSDRGVGHPEVRPTASALGTAAATTSASAIVIGGRRRARSISSSLTSPIWMGERRTMNELAPTMLSAMFSFT